MLRNSNFSYAQTNFFALLVFSLFAQLEQQAFRII